MLGDPITLRLSVEQKALLEDEAARQGKRLSTYVRELLESENDLQGALAALRREIASLHHVIEDLADTGPRSDQSGRGSEGGTMEPRWLLRAIARPERAKVAWGELRRSGYEPWSVREAV